MCYCLPGFKGCCAACCAACRKLFTELSRVGDPESQALCGAMVEELEPSLRYCQYQIERAGGAAPDPSKLTALAEGPEGSGGSLLQVSFSSGDLQPCMQLLEQGSYCLMTQRG